MAKKKIKPKYMQLDIDAAMAGKEVVIEVKEDELLETGGKSLSPFDFVKDIRGVKSGTMLDKEQDEKSWTSFMVLRILSMSSYDIDLCNIMNQYQGIIPKKSMYDALLGLIEKDRKFYKFISTRSVAREECIKLVARYYELPESQANEYVEIMGEEWAKAIESKYDCGVVKIKR